MSEPVDMEIFSPPKGGWGGRPTDYNPDFCNELIQLGEQGASITQMAYHCGVTKQTLLNWCERHAEFLEAYTRAKMASQCWWEKAGQGGMFMSGFSAGTYSRSMAARFPEDWRENKGVEVSGGLDVRKIERTVVSPTNTDR